ncbi:helix-turn-helix domain-containing protein [Billgrantia endophytica]|uniref:AraC family transcriptional regulator n=1 Tax=Billgrantia endophytica TaxID=2033802 RepID=A0A2N7U6B6_9GAMM|nr:helix-turn-helix domain-containing protein [Halomonas endophytica]PMR75969.1 AraC family transcriptional regulator [Halomonas endophytica]
MSIRVPYSVFDNRCVEASDRFDAWRENIAPVFDVEPQRGVTPASLSDFLSRVEAYHLGNMMVGRAQTAAQRFRHARPNQRVDHLLVQVHRRGGFQGRLGDIDARAGAAHVSLIDLGRPLATETSDTDILNLNVLLPRDLFADRPAFLDGAHGLVLGPERGAFFADYLQALLNRLPTLPYDDADSITTITRDMILVCCAADAEARARVAAPLQALQRQRIERFIERRLSSPQLTPDMLCRAAAISRTRLYRLFEHDGGVMHYIQSQRLARIRACLEDPGEHRSIGELAADYGFRSQSHFSRCFHAHYQLTPHDVRQRARVTAGVTPPSSAPNTTELAAWIRQLRNA